MLAELIREYLARVREWSLRVVVSSAHTEALEIARAVMDEFPSVPAEFWHFETAYAGKREEEISFCKEQLPKRLGETSGWEWLWFYDADVWTRLAQVPEWMRIIGEERGRCFVKIKYTLRDKLASPAHTLGAYFHHRALMERVQYWRKVFPRDAAGRRRGAPDCLLHDYLHRNGCRKVVPATIRTLHFTNIRDAQVFALGKCDTMKGVRTEEGAWSAESHPMRGWTPIYRIQPTPPMRSRVAAGSQLKLFARDFPAVAASDGSLRSRERATSLAHAGVVRAFLESEAELVVVLEDDAIVGAELNWMGLTEFDLFLPFSHNREHRPFNPTVRCGVLPKYGAFAYLCSRKLAARMLPRLLAGEVADHALHRAAAGLRVGCLAGNAVNHDNQCSSMVSEGRRKKFAHLGRQTGREGRSEPDAALATGRKLLIGICTCQANAAKREAVRDTWMPSGTDVQAYFFAGAGPDAESDMIRLNVTDDYAHLPAKVGAFYRHVLEHYEFDWLFKCDDDTYVAVERLIELITTHDLVGNEFLNRRGPNKFASGGAGYLLSRRMVEKLAENMSLAAVGPEDVIFTGAALFAGATWRATARLGWNANRIPRRENDQVSCHRISPEKMRAIHAAMRQYPVRVLEIIHPRWHDRVALFESGFFTRCAAADYGRWSWEDSNHLLLEWFDWNSERFQIQAQEAARLVMR